MRILVFSANSAVVQQMVMELKAHYSEAIFYCVARNEQDFDRFSEKISDRFAGSSFYDFTDFAKAEDVVVSANEAMGGIDLAIIGQGFLPDQMATEGSFELAQECFEINCLSILSCLIPIVNILKQQASGKIAVISSVAGDRGRPRNFTYGAAKSAVSIYLQGLRSVFYKSGIEIYDFKLGPVDTPMTADHEKNFSFSSKEKAAKIMVKALKKKRYVRYVPSFWYWVLLAVKSMPENIFQKLKFLSAR